jgi:uncharacterized BrkB/YihY/UPF0761 family membrane protein
MHKKKIIIFLIFFIILTFLPCTVLAGVTGVGGDSPTTLDDPIGIKSPQALIGQVINVALGLVGSVALLMFIYGGFVWMFSMGNTTKIQKGKDILLWSTAGLVVIFSAYALVKFVLQKIIGLT